MQDKSPEVRLAAEIASALNEESPVAMGQIKQIILTCGPKFATDRLRETIGAEKSGGMMTDDGLRRRTAGGTFLKICKNRMTQGERLSVFGRRQRRNQ